MQELIKRLRNFAEYEADLADESKWERIEWEAADLIESQAAEISELRELNLAQIKTIRTLQTKVSYYKEISEDMERELNGRV